LLLIMHRTAPRSPPVSATFPRTAYAFSSHRHQRLINYYTSECSFKLTVTKSFHVLPTFIMEENDFVLFESYRNWFD
jgi:hypothetical protein